MNQEEFRKLWDEAGEGEEIEVRITASEARINPETARTLLQALAQVVQTDRSYASIYRVVIDALLDDATERLANDDAFVLRIANKLIDVMEVTTPPRRTPRGKVRTAKSA